MTKTNRVMIFIICCIAGFFSIIFEIFGWVFKFGSSQLYNAFDIYHFLIVPGFYISAYFVVFLHGAIFFTGGILNSFYYYIICILIWKVVSGELIADFALMRPQKIALVALSLVIVAILCGIIKIRTTTYLGKYDGLFENVAVELNAPDICKKINPASNQRGMVRWDSNGTAVIQEDCYYFSALKNHNPEICKNIRPSLILWGLKTYQDHSANACLADIKAGKSFVLNDYLGRVANSTYQIPAFFTELGYSLEDLNKRKPSYENSYFYILHDASPTEKTEFLERIRHLK